MAAGFTQRGDGGAGTFRMDRMSAAPNSFEKDRARGAHRGRRGERGVDEGAGGDEEDGGAAAPCAPLTPAAKATPVLLRDDLMPPLDEEGRGRFRWVAEACGPCRESLCRSRLWSSRLRCEPWRSRSRSRPRCDSSRCEPEVRLGRTDALEPEPSAFGEAEPPPCFSSLTPDGLREREGRTEPCEWDRDLETDRDWDRDREGEADREREGDRGGERRR